jgi:competence protein ComEA
LQAEFRGVVTLVTHASAGPSYVRAVPSEGSRTPAAILVVAALVAVFAVVRLNGSSSQGGGGEPVRIDGPSATGPARHEAMIYVHVVGAVRQPGLLRLPSGSRVATAVKRAGGAGPRAELSGVNLAARLEDGQQVLVPVRGAAAAGGLAPGAGASGSAGAGTPGAAGVPKASLGSATVEQLDQIDGIGPTLAQRIIEYRTEHGGFRSMGELREVEGIGEKRFETLREALQP